MASDTQSHTNPASPPETAMSLLRTAWKATLATIDTDSGHPYGSLVAVATRPDGTPILLVSDLAWHTRNLKADSRASLLVDGTPAGREALTGPRVTFIGSARPLTGTSLERRRYAARHPSAEMLTGFADFHFYALEIERAHLVAGFGRIERIERGALIAALDGAEAMIAAEEGIVAHMNRDHADALRSMARRSGATADGGWQMTGCDPDGCDLVCGDAAVRVPFSQRINSPEAARAEFIRLVAQARKSP